MNKFGNLLFLVLGLVLFYSCDIPAQQLDVVVNYTVQINDDDGLPIDSAKIILWKGTNINDCPIEEDGSWESLNKTGLTIDNIPVPSNSYTFELTSNGEWIKIALVQFGSSWSSDLATTTFIKLPTKPRKVVIGNVTIIPR